MTVVNADNVTYTEHSKYKLGWPSDKTTPNVISKIPYIGGKII